MFMVDLFCRELNVQDLRMKEVQDNLEAETYFSVSIKGWKFYFLAHVMLLWQNNWAVQYNLLVFIGLLFVCLFIVFR